MRALWPFGQDSSQADSFAALEAADLSHRRAVQDRCQASATRAEADAWAQQVRDHNTANRYDDWLRTVLGGGK